MKNDNAVYRTGLSAVMMLCLALAWTKVEAEPNEELSRQFRSIVERLDSSVLTERDQAFDELVKNYDRFDRLIPEDHFVRERRFFSPEVLHRFELARQANREAWIAKLDGLFEATFRNASTTDRNRSSSPLVAVQLTMTLPPEIMPVRLTLDMAGSLFIDRDHRTWKSVVRAGSQEIEILPDSNQLELSLNLTTKENPPASFDSFVQGRIPCSVLMGRGMKTFVFDAPFSDLAPLPRTYKTDRIALSLFKATRTETETRILMKVQYTGAADAFESHRDWLLRRRFLLESDKQRIEPTRIIQHARTDQGATLEFIFPTIVGKPDSYRLTAELPQELLEHKVMVSVHFPAAEPDAR